MSARSPSAAAAAAMFLCLGSACSEQVIGSANIPPGATLIFPSPDGSTSAFETTPVVLRGRVSDTQGDDGLDFTFISDVDGELGRGLSGAEGEAELEALTLTVGEHSITLQVVDASSASGSATAPLLVVPNSSPVLTVTTPEGAVFLEESPVILEGTVADSDHEVSSLEVSASSDTVEVGVDPVINGDGFEGEWFLVLSGVPVGNHAIVLEATDPLGKVGGAVALFQVAACVDEDGDGWTPCNGDCNDADVSLAPGRPEQCNGIDDDCDGQLGPAELDGDGDGVSDCDGDCNDGDAAVGPAASEACNGLDDDCDGVVPVDELDLDGDGASGCAGDCGPLNPLMGPAATEACNGLDDNCDGALPASEADGDGDGVPLCAGDCDDAAPAISPIALEICDGLDNDCDGALPAAETDPDGDGFAACAGDCAALDGDSYPGAPELCDSADNDCDGLLPSDELDLDADGVTGCGGDCAPNSPVVWPGAPEICDGIDDDCDGNPGPNELDLDGDGFWTCQGDCDDSDATIYPGSGC
jgi:hypothetical protein